MKTENSSTAVIQVAAVTCDGTSFSCVTEKRRNNFESGLGLEPHLTHFWRLDPSALSYEQSCDFAVGWGKAKGRPPIPDVARLESALCRELLTNYPKMLRGGTSDDMIP